MHCAHVNDFDVSHLQILQEERASKIWVFHQLKLIAEPYNYYVFSTEDIPRRDAIAQAIKAEILDDILPESLFFLDDNGLPVGYRIEKTLSLYPNISVEKHVAKASKDLEYTDSQAVQNLLVRLKRITDMSDFCFVELSSDKLGIFENRCFLVDDEVTALKAILIDKQRMVFRES